MERYGVRLAFQRAEFLRSKLSYALRWQEWSYQGNLPTLNWLILSTSLPADQAMVIFTRWTGIPSRETYVVVNKSTTSSRSFTINFRPNVSSWTVWGNNGTTGTLTGTASSVDVILPMGDGIVVECVVPSP